MQHTLTILVAQLQSGPRTAMKQRMNLLHNPGAPIIASLMFVLASFACRPSLAAETRDDLLEHATAHWRLGDGAQDAQHPLTKIGDIQLNVAAEGEGATAGAKVARLTGAYFDAGKDLRQPMHGLPEGARSARTMGAGAVCQARHARHHQPQPLRQWRPVRL